MVKPDMNWSEVHPQLSQNRHLVGCALVVAGLLGHLKMVKLDWEILIALGHHIYTLIRSNLTKLVFFNHGQSVGAGSNHALVEAS